MCLLAILVVAGAAQDTASRGEPVLRIRAEGTFELETNRAVRLGDTVTYRLRVSWNEIPAAVRLSPRAVPLEASGFIVAGSSVAHARTSRTDTGDAPASRTDYIYRLIPREAGIARVAPFVVRYHNGLTGREEELNVPAASVTVLPAPVPFYRRTATLTLMALLALFVFGLVTYLVVTRPRPPGGRTSRKSTSPSRNGAPETAARTALTALRARCDSADGRLWVAEAEQVCIAWLCRRLGVTNPDHVRFEAALDQYLDRYPAQSLAARNGWTTLRELFHGTRYGGVRCAPHELHEACRILNICLLTDPRETDNRTSQGVTPS